MKPIDFRNATFADLQLALAGMRAAVLSAWCQHGPGTTAEVCARAGMSILTFRPRTTELVQLGFVTLAGEQPQKGEGTYRARTPAEHQAWFREQRYEATNPQLSLQL